MSPGERREVDELQRRARQLAQQYDVDQQRVRHWTDRFAAQTDVLRIAYIAGAAHAVLLEAAEAHADCIEIDCRLCHVLGEAVAQVLATEQVDTDAQLAALVNQQPRRRTPRLPWQRDDEADQ